MRQAVIVSTARTPLTKAHRGEFNITPGPTLAAFAVRADWCRLCKRPPRRPREDHRSRVARRTEAYLTARTSTVWISGSLASRSGPTCAKAFGISPLR